MVQAHILAGSEGKVVCSPNDVDTMREVAQTPHTLLEGCRCSAPTIHLSMTEEVKHTHQSPAPAQ